MPKQTNRGSLRSERGRIPNKEAARRACVVWGSNYSIGVANLGHQRVWALADAAAGWSADRYYVGTPSKGVGRSWQSGTPLSEFDLLLFSFAFEGDYQPTLEFLRGEGLLAEHEERKGPLLIAGGIAPSLNPLPLAPFFDGIYLGDAEVMLPTLIEELAELDPADSRQRQWELLQRRGLHVDALGGDKSLYYRWTSTEGTYAASEVVSPAGHFGETALVELGRGCPRGCLFCASRWAAKRYRPAEPLALREQILERATTLDVQRLGLVGTAVAEGNDFPALLHWLEEQNLSATASSLRADLLTVETARLLVRLGQQTLTLSAEAGSETLRRKLGKGLTNEALLNAVKAVAVSDARVLKLYFMYGLPGETDEDLAAIGRLTGELRRVLEGSPAHLKISASPFVPKPMTPLVDHPLLTENELRRKRALLVEILRKAKINSFTGESPRQALWQAVLARGDATLLRRLLAGESKSQLIRRNL
jgi:radical SAM superfamily enzyme YgiQ (UPF0313 family)